jgi:hypothetical protein
MISRICSGTKGQPCGRIIPGNARRCDACAETYNRATNRYRRQVRGTTAQRGYGAHWQAISIKRRRQYPTCEYRFDGCTFLATEVDHVRPVRAGGRSVWSNARSSCHSCNNAKRAHDLESWPLDRFPEAGVTRP